MLKIFKPKLFILIIVMVLGLIFIPTNTTLANTPPRNDWQMIFNDEFDGTQLNLNKWTRNAPDSPNETELYSWGGDTICYPGSVSVANGYLQLGREVRPQNNPFVYNGKNYYNLDGVVQSRGKFEFKYGYAEARMKLDDGPTGGAFWLMPECIDYDYDNDGTIENYFNFIDLGGKGAEVDIMEHFQAYQNSTTANCAIHIGGYDAKHSVPYNKTYSVSSSLSNWHTYGLEWTPTTYNFYVDDVLVATYSGKGVSQCPEMLVLTRGNSTQPTLVDYVRVYQKPTPEMTNLARYSSVVVSSCETTSFTADKAVDADKSTRWSSAYSDSEWVTVDLGKQYPVSKVILNWEYAYAKAYTIQTSTDGTNWTDVYNTTSGNGDIDDISFNTVTARYVRMQGIQRATKYGYSIYEFEVYGNAPGSRNVALNKSVTVSSNEASTTYIAANAVDGNTQTRWSTQHSDPQWISIDLGQQYTINRAVLKWEDAYGKTYKIQTSNDGTNWTDVYSTASGDGAIDDISFSPISARYIRMYGTQRGTIYGYSLWEFEIYGD